MRATQQMLLGCTGAFFPTRGIVPELFPRQTKNKVRYEIGTQIALVILNGYCLRPMWPYRVRYRSQFSNTHSPSIATFVGTADICELVHHVFPCRLPYLLPLRETVRLSMVTGRREIMISGRVFSKQSQSLNDACGRRLVKSARNPVDNPQIRLLPASAGCPFFLPGTASGNYGTVNTRNIR